MFSRFFSVPAAWLLAPGAAFLLALSAVAPAAVDRVRLDAAVLAQSRGANQLLVLTQSSCNVL